MEELQSLRDAVRMFYGTLVEKDEDADVLDRIEKEGSTKAEKLEVQIRYLKLLMAKEQKADKELAREIRTKASSSWFLIKGGLDNRGFQMAQKHYDAILRKVQALPLNAKQVKEFEEAVRAAEENRKKYGK